ncbi:type IV pilus modification protein PilV, partial [Thiospirillum jenense]
MNLINRQRGFTLIEVLVAALVLSIGLLGLAALSATSLKLNTGSAQRTQAANLSYAITDAMRANKTNVAAYVGSYDVANCQNNFVANAGSLAANDIAEWRNYLAC